MQKKEQRADGFTICLLQTPGEGRGDDPGPRTKLQDPPPLSRDPHPTSPVLAVFWRLDEGRAGPAPRLTMARHDRCCQCAWPVPVNANNSCGPSGLGRAACLCLVANCIDAEVRDDFSRVQEMLVVEVVSFW